MKMITPEECDAAERVIRAAGLQPSEFSYVRGETQEASGARRHTITVSRGKVSLECDRGAWPADLERALQAGRFK